MAGQVHADETRLTDESKLTVNEAQRTVAVDPPVA